MMLRVLDGFIFVLVSYSLRYDECGLFYGTVLYLLHPVVVSVLESNHIPVIVSPFGSRCWVVFYPPTSVRNRRLFFFRGSLLYRLL